jgi:uncharacterized protein YdeI (BOF family)
MMRLLLLSICAALLAGCSGRESKILGTAVEGVAVNIASIPQTTADSRIVLHGTMTKKCPVAGCWFVLKDETGTIKVDTKNGGFAVIDVPLNTSLTVAGRVVMNGRERLIDATGVCY